MKYKFLKILFTVIIFSSLFNCTKTDKTKITIWHTKHTEGRKLLDQIINDYMKKNPDIEVEAVFKETEELRSSFQTAAFANGGPELIYGPADQVGPFVSMKLIKPLDDFFSEAELNQFIPNGLVRLNKSLYSIADETGNHLILVYNKDLISEPPQNTDEMIEISEQILKETNGKKYGIVWNFTEPFFFIPWYSGFGGWVMDDQGNPTLNNKAAENSFQFVKDLIDKYKIAPKNADYNTADALFKEGNSAMIINGPWSWSGYREAGINYGLAPIPKVSETGIWPAPMVSAKGYSINANTSEEKIDQTVKLLKYLTSTEVQLLFTEKQHTVPTTYKAQESTIVKSDPFLIQSQKQISYGKPMPIIPEMRAVWDAMRPAYQAVLNGTMKPNDVALQMQNQAEKMIAEMNEETETVFTPSNRSIVISLAAVFLIFIILIFSVRKIRNKIFKNRLAYYYMLPGILILLFVVVYPFIYNIIISFSNMNMKHFTDWGIIGFQNFAKVFSEKILYSVFFKTVIWTVVNVALHVIIGVYLALLLNRKIKGKAVFRILLILPWAVPQYITALTWRGMFNTEYGAINIFLSNFLSMSPVNWLNEPLNAFIACIITNVWLGFPFMMVVALGGLQSIPQELYEAASVDGASKWKQFWNITVPLLKPVMIPAITLGTIWTFNNLNIIWLVSNGGEPSDKTHILVSYVYKAAFTLYRYGYAAALSLIIFLILLVFGIGFLKKTKGTEGVY